MTTDVTNLATMSFTESDEPEPVPVLEPEATTAPVAEPETEPAPEAPVDEPTASEVPQPLTDPERKQFEELKVAQRQSAVQAAIAQIQQEAAKVRTDNTALYGEDAANVMATQHVTLRTRELEATLMGNQSQENDRVKKGYAESVGKEFGVPPESLMDAGTLGQMRSQATVLKELNGLRKEVKTGRPRAEPQHLESNSTEMGGGSDAKALLTALGEGRMEPSQLTKDQLEMIAKYEG